MPFIRRWFASLTGDSSEAALVDPPIFRPPPPHDVVPLLELNDGNIIPVLGWGLGSVLKIKEKKEGEIVQSLAAIATRAITTGFYHLDTSQLYNNEEELGQAIEASGIPRERLFVTTKIDARKEHVLADELDRSLAKLGLGYVDLYLADISSWNSGSDKRLQKMWAEMEAIKDSGRARSIGVSNFEQRHLELVLKKARIPPAVNQIEFHPYRRYVSFLQFHRRNKIAVAGYGCLMPLTQARGGPVDSLYTTLALKYGVSETEIGLRWALDQGVVPITTSSNPQRLQTLRSRLFKFNLTSAEVEQITRMGLERDFTGDYSSFYNPVASE